MSVQPALDQPTSQPVDSFDAWWADRSRLVSRVESRRWDSEKRQSRARVYCAELTKAFWDAKTQKDRTWFKDWTRGPALDLDERRELREAAGSLDALSLIEAGYLVGSLYTALLPSGLRAERGAYYTPPILAERLLDLSAASGVDWAHSEILDPACGGGAFLVPAAHRVLGDHRIRALQPAERLEHLESHLAGIEIDPFAAWLSQAFLQLLTLEDCRRAGRALNVPIHVADALSTVVDDSRTFDLVIGNPPYGRLKLDASQRRYFSRSLFGHANLYGVFLDAALRWRKPDGLVAFLTPTSFLGGQYFSKLRALLLEEAPPLSIDIVDSRRGVFDSVLQETCLTVFGRNSQRSTVTHLLKVEDRKLSCARAGVFEMGLRPRAPWMLPRSPEQARLLTAAAKMPTRLEDLGFKASTGPLVWNRHKSQLAGEPRGNRVLPIVWAEAVRANRFSFSYRSRASTSWLQLEDGQNHLIDREPCALVQRTTAKEQKRRLISCAVPEDFLRRHGGIVVENHVNVLRRVVPEIASPRSVAAMLNTEAVDQVFRCLSGSVAVSASELHALPLPPPEVFQQIDRLLDEDPESIEDVVREAYEHLAGVELDHGLA